MLRLIIGFLLAPTGVLLFVVLSTLLRCLTAADASSCDELMDSVLAGVFVFPVCWLFQLIIGVPVIQILKHFKLFNGRNLIVSGILTGVLIYLPGAIGTWSDSILSGLLLVSWGAFAAGIISFTFWYIGYKKTG